MGSKWKWLQLDCGDDPAPSKQGEIRSSEILIATYHFKGHICHSRTNNATWDTLLLPTMCQSQTYVQDFSATVSHRENPWASRVSHIKWYSGILGFLTQFWELFFFENYFYCFLRCRVFVKVYFLVLSQSRKFLGSNLFFFLIGWTLLSSFRNHCSLTEFSFFIFLLKSWVLFELLLAPCA